MSGGLKTATLCMVLMATAAVAQPPGRDEQPKSPPGQAHGGQGGGQRGPGEGPRGQAQMPGGPGAARADGGDRGAKAQQTPHPASMAQNPAQNPAQNLGQAPAQPNHAQRGQGSPLQRSPDNGAHKQAYQGPTNRPQPAVPEPSRAGQFGGAQDRGARAAGQSNAGPNRGPGDRGPSGNHQFVYQGRPHDVIRRSGFRYPSGYSYRRWGIGQSLPLLFMGSAYYFSDYVDYGFGRPPHGFVWVRYGPDLLLVERRTGRIRDVIYGVFYDY